MALLSLVLSLLAATAILAADPDPVQDFCVADLDSSTSVNGAACLTTASAREDNFTSTVLRNVQPMPCSLHLSGSISPSLTSSSTALLPDEKHALLNLRPRRLLTYAGSLFKQMLFGIPTASKLVIRIPYPQQEFERCTDSDLCLQELKFCQHKYLTKITGAKLK
ncbi:hypothetical protein SELMODRAFT_448008 [Selaginella moellendorffii]|uniref:Uncharacterized protein n=1 Tax=Selaginella moellendorffii TaxID=88036 RepID=D8T446_SELML|nr:hypothetical protein SELMODRAFT_448008 [Selaginella moellendorffii]